MIIKWIERAGAPETARQTRTQQRESGVSGGVESAGFDQRRRLNGRGKARPMIWLADGILFETEKKKKKSSGILPAVAESHSAGILPPLLTESAAVLQKATNLPSFFRRMHHVSASRAGVSIFSVLDVASKTKPNQSNI